MNISDRIPTPKFEVNFEDDALIRHPAYLEAAAPLAYWKMNALTGTTEEDRTAGNRDLTYANAPTLGAAGAFTASHGDIDTAVTFNGTDEYGATATDTTWKNLTAAWTLSAWIYPTASRSGSQNGSGIVAATRPSGTQIPFFLNYGAASGAGVTGDKVFGGFFHTDSTFKIVQDPTAVTLNQWVHYTVTWDGTTVTLYKNGVSVGTPLVPGVTNAAAAGTPALEVGRFLSGVGTQPYFPGTIDEVAVWDRAISLVEAANLYKYLTIATPDPGNYIDLTALPDSRDGQEFSRLRSFSPRVGRSDPANRIEAATATVVLSNHDGLLSPAPIVNMLPNPSAEMIETGLPFREEGGTVTYDIAHVRTGVRAWKLTTTTQPQVYATTEGEGFIGLRPGKTYTFSVYPYVATGGGIALSDVTAEIVEVVGGTETATASGNPAALDTIANRISVTRTIPANATAAWVRVKANSGGVAGRTIWFDDAQLEEAGSASTFVYGESTDCTWLGEEHRSPTICRTGGFAKAGLPFRACRLTGTWDSTDYDVLNGYIERATFAFPAGGEDATVTYSIVDGTRILSNASMRGFARASERVGDRVRAILAWAGVAEDNMDVDDEGIDVLALTAQATVADDTTALALIRDIEQTERGEFYVARDGTFTYQGSLVRSPGAAEVVVFSDEDDSLEIRYSDIALNIDVGTVVNDVNIENVASGNDHTFDYPLSQARYFAISSSEQSKWATDTASNEDRSIPFPSAEQMTVYGVKNPDVWWPTLLDLELGSLCRIERHHAGEDLWQGYVHFLEGYSIDAAPGRWTMNFLTSPSLAHPIVADLWQTPIAKPILLVAGGQAGGDVTVASRTYTAGRLYVLFVYGRRADGSIPSQPTFTSGNTWNSERQDTSSTSTVSHRFSTFSTVPSGNVTESLGINFVTDPTTAVYWAIMEVREGFNAADPIGANNGGGTGTPFAGTIDVGTLADARSIVLIQSWKDSSAAGAIPNYSGAVLLDSRATGGDTNAVAYSSIPGNDTIGFAYGQAGGWGNQVVEVKAL